MFFFFFSSFKTVTMVCCPYPRDIFSFLALLSFFSLKMSSKECKKKKKKGKQKEGMLVAYGMLF